MAGAAWSTRRPGRSSARDISGILPRGGTILRTSRTNPFSDEESLARLLRNLAAWMRWSPSAARTRLESPHACTASMPRRWSACPKTIDNDLRGTDYTFGFDTAVTIATEAIDRLHSTAESHDRVMVCEVMGRHTGWIAVHAGMAGGADVILIPEHAMTVERCCELITHRHARGKDFSIVVVSEGYQLTFASRRVTSRRVGATRTRSGTPGWAVSAPTWRPRSSAAPGSRRG